jgi:hypothetical protein
VGVPAGYSHPPGFWPSRTLSASTRDRPEAQNPRQFRPEGAFTGTEQAVECRSHRPLDPCAHFYAPQRATASRRSLAGHRTPSLGISGNPCVDRRFCNRSENPKCFQNSVLGDHAWPTAIPPVPCQRCRRPSPSGLHAAIAWHSRWPPPPAHGTPVR